MSNTKLTECLPKNVYEKNYEILHQICPNIYERLLAGDIDLSNENHIQLKIELLKKQNNYYDITISHNFVENGDVVPDPEFILRLYPKYELVEIVQYQDRFGIRYVYLPNGKIDPKAKIELNHYFSTWVSQINIHEH